MRSIVRAGTALAMCLWATEATAATWVRYGFTGTGTARNVSAGSPQPGDWQSVTFSGQAYVDLDRHAMDFATGQLWESDGGTSFSRPSMLGGQPLRATAGIGSLALSANEGNFASGFQNWTVAALLSGGAGADGRFPVFSGAQAATGNVAFNIGNFRSSWNGTGRLSSVTMARVDAPGSWILSISPGPVPEPATWAAMLVGFAAIGSGMRYRRRSTRVSIG